MNSPGNSLFRSSIAWVALLLAATACGTKSQVSSRWKSDAYTSGPMRKILVIAITDTQLGRVTWEDRFASLLNKQKVEAVPSHKLLPTEEKISEEELRKTVAAHGFDGVIATQLIEVAEKKTVVPPSTQTIARPGGYGGYGGYGYGSYYGRSYDVVHTPGYTKITEVVRLETRLWEAKSAELVWGVTSETFDPTSTDDAILSVTKTITSQLEKDGMVSK